MMDLLQYTQYPCFDRAHDFATDLLVTSVQLYALARQPDDVLRRRQVRFERVEATTLSGEGLRDRQFASDALLYTKLWKDERIIRVIAGVEPQVAANAMPTGQPREPVAAPGYCRSPRVDEGPLEVENTVDPEGLPVTVVVPLSAHRKEFFEKFCLPSIRANRPKKISVVRGKGGACCKRNLGFAEVDTPYVFLQTNGTVYRRFRPSLVNLAFHPASMSGQAAERWWDRLASWMDDGHEVVVQLIADPSHLKELEQYYHRALEFVSKDQVYVRYLLGQHGGRRLPQGYTEEELTRIKPLMHIRTAEEEHLRKGPPSFRGRPCGAGRELAVISADGGVYRCTGAMATRKGQLGSLKNGFRLAPTGSSPAKCKYPCSCIYQGLWYCFNL